MKVQTLLFLLGITLCSSTYAGSMHKIATSIFEGVYAFTKGSRAAHWGPDSTAIIWRFFQAITKTQNLIGRCCGGRRHPKIIKGKVCVKQKFHRLMNLSS